MKRHTPGPWKIIKATNGTLVIGTAEEEVAHTMRFRTIDESGMPNAKLVAAAPELLQALTQLMDRLDYHGSIDLIREEGPIEDARAAIEKATV